MTLKLDALAITWPLSSLSGYGVYGAQIAQQFFRAGGQKLILTQDSPHYSLPPNLPSPLRQSLQTGLQLGTRLSEFLVHHPSETLAFNHAGLFAIGNDGRGFAGQDQIWARPAIGCAALEHLVMTAHGLEILRRYQHLIAISKWNAAYLKSLNLAPVSLCYQGIDSRLFYPKPRMPRWPDRFVIFSGGKFEFRKAQDIVVAAFRQFHARHTDALLVTAWQTPYSPDATLFQMAGHCQTTPESDGNGGLAIDAWLNQQGLPSSSFLTLPYTPNHLMPDLLGACDAAVFPNRCEGGTNLVAMEAMACGVPTIVANNTGQKDLVELFGCAALQQQSRVKAIPQSLPVSDWGESNVEELVTWLEHVYQAATAARLSAADIAVKLKNFDWANVNAALLETVAQS